MLANDAKQTIIHGLKETFMEEGSCISGMDTSLCSPEADECFNMTLSNIKTTTFQGDSVSQAFKSSGVYL